MTWLLVLFAAVTGVLNTIQSGSNTTLQKTIAAPGWSAAVVFAVALATAVVSAVVSGERVPSTGTLAQLPWWAWIGGVFGAAFIICMMVAAGKLGAAVFSGVTVTAGVVTSLVMDHFGLLGFEVHTAGWGRWAGGALMLLGLERKCPHPGRSAVMARSVATRPSSPSRLAGLGRHPLRCARGRDDG